MKSLKINIITLLVLAFTISGTQLFAQCDKNNKDGDKVIIIKKRIDENGNQINERIVKRGNTIITHDITEGSEEGDVFIFNNENNERTFERTVEIIEEKDGETFTIEIEDLPGEAMNFMHNMEVDVDALNGEKIIKVKMIDDDGKVTELEWEGDGEIPTEFRSMIGEGNPQGNDNMGGKRYVWKKTRGSDCNTPFLGVVMSKSVSVTNDNGVETETITGESDQGVLISSVVDGSGAKSAGILANDIIYEMDDSAVSNIDELTEVISSHEVGDQISVAYIRNGARGQTMATLGSKCDSKRIGNKNYNYDYHYNDEDYSAYGYEVDPCKVFIGVSLNSSSRRSENGVAVTEIIEDTPAEEAGLQKGDIISAIDGQRVYSFNDIITERDKHEPGDKFTITYARNGQTLTVDATFKSCETKDISFIDLLENMEEEKEEPVENVNVSPREEETYIPMQALELQDMSVFPNPTEGRFSVQFKGEAVPTVVSIVDITGKEVYREELNNFNGLSNRQIELNKGTAAGTLLLTITQGDQRLAEKIIYTNGKL